jgi:hypothetical protein
MMTSSNLTTDNQSPENSLRRASGELLYRSYRCGEVSLASATLRPHKQLCSLPPFSLCQL